MHVHPSLSLIILPTILLDLKHCQDGRWSYSARLVLIPQLSSHTLQGLQQAYCTASLWAVSRFVSWQIGPQRVVFTTNFINVTCNDYCESCIFCMYIDWSQYTFDWCSLFLHFMLKLHGVSSEFYSRFGFCQLYLTQLFSLPMLNIWFGSAIKYMNLNNFSEF